MSSSFRYYAAGRTKGVFCLMVLFLLMSLGPSPAFAHRVNVFAWVDGDTVHTESSFGGKKPVRGGEIVVYNADEKELVKGTTDDEGLFSFKVPEKTELTVILNATMGHKAQWKIAADELGGVPEKEAPPESKDRNKENAGQSSPETTPTVAVAPGLTEEDLRRIVTEVVDAKTKPIVKIITDATQSGPSFRDVLGGIGYIIGLFGIAAYVQSRKKPGEKPNPGTKSNQ